MGFDEAWPLLARAAERGDHVTREQVKRSLETGAAFLWTGENSAVWAVADGDTLRIALAGGDLGELKDIHERIAAWANGRFSRLEIIGRGGWEKALPGYRRAAVLLRREL